MDVSQQKKGTACCPCAAEQILVLQRLLTRSEKLCVQCTVWSSMAENAGARGLHSAATAYSAFKRAREQARSLLAPSFGERNKQTWLLGKRLQDYSILPLLGAGATGLAYGSLSAAFKLRLAQEHTGNVEALSLGLCPLHFNWFKRCNLACKRTFRNLPWSVVPCSCARQQVTPEPFFHPAATWCRKQSARVFPFITDNTVLRPLF